MYFMLFLIEFCGIFQLIVMRYGSVLIVREIGGFKDIVKLYNQFIGGGWGFFFVNYELVEFFVIIKYVFFIYIDKVQWRFIVYQVMIRDNLWNVLVYEY